MIQIDMEMPKTCEECPMNYADLVCAGMYYILKDMDMVTKRIMADRFKVQYDVRPKWCPLKEEK